MRPIATTRGNARDLHARLERRLPPRLDVRGTSSRRPPQQTDRLTETAFDTLAMPVAVLDRNGRIRLVNTSWRHLLRASGRSIDGDGVGAGYLGVGILGAIGKRDALALRTGLRKVLRGAAARLQRVIRVKCDGKQTWYQVRAVRVSIGGQVKVVVTHDDVSAIHAAQHRIEELSQRLLTLQEEERARIAVELHDSTAQQLTAAGLYLSSLRSRWPVDAETQRSVKQIEQTIGEARKEIRTLSYLLHPPYLDRDGLRITLSRFVAGFARRTGLTATAHIPNDVDGFLPGVQLALLRIVQEALSNVHRHASASRVAVRIRITRTTILFGIFDNGKGIGVAAGCAGAALEQPPGLGIPGMRTRIHHLGGVLRIRSGHCGTRILGKIPLVRSLSSSRAVRSVAPAKVVAI